MSKYLSILVAILLISCFIQSSGFAAKLTLEPEKVSLITSSTDKENTRVLVYFDLPKKLEGKETHIAYAKLVFSVELENASMGDIEVFPVTKSWKELGSIDWSNTWDTDGGDFSQENIGIHVTAKSSKGKQTLRSDVTFMVKAWLDGVIDNHGMIIVPSEADMSISDAEYSIDMEGITLVITYDY